MFKVMFFHQLKTIWNGFLTTGHPMDAIYGNKLEAPTSSGTGQVLSMPSISARKSLLNSAIHLMLQNVRVLKVKSATL